MADEPKAAGGFPFGTVLDWASKLLPIAAMGVFFVVENAAKTDANTKALSEFSEITGKGIAALAAEVHELRNDIKNLPGYEARISGLEKEHGDMSLRLRLVEDTSARNSQDIANAKVAQYRVR